MRANRTSCFIGGAGHSGSTLLGLSLGAHPEVFYGGEAKKSTLFGNEKKPLRKRMCKVCGPGCRVWTDLTVNDEVDLYEALSVRTGRPVVVDSTKALEWIEAQGALVRSRGAATVLIVLGRDGRAVLGSGLRKYPETSAAEHAAKWLEQMTGTEALASRWVGPVLRVRYEAFVTEPEATLQGLAEALGVDFDAAMLAPFDSEQHPLGGNAGTQSLLTGPTGTAQTAVGGSVPISGSKKDYYEAHPKTFVLDQRWRREVPAEALAEFERVVDGYNAAYAWEPA